MEWVEVDGVGVGKVGREGKGWSEEAAGLGNVLRQHLFEWTCRWVWNLSRSTWRERGGGDNSPRKVRRE